jgi:hypothetical protein
MNKDEFYVHPFDLCMLISSRREISDIQITQELSSFLFKDALWSFNLNPNENQKAIGDVTQVTES